MATGGTITYSGGYTIHTFTSSGTFTPAGPMDVDMFILSPGAGGAAAGGGAGGMREITSIAVTATGYTITCASYGLGKSEGATTGTDGGNSSGLGYTNEGGGGGGYTYENAGRYGGSGGGAGGINRAPNYWGYGLGASGQGNRGGGVTYWGSSPSGGGGGKGAVGSNTASSTKGGNGGNGSSSSYSGSAVTYAGGGGGGCKWSSTTANNSLGGTGGGGAGKCRYQGTGGAGTHYLGGGGGGAGYGAVGGRGGYGVIIIRYLTGADEEKGGSFFMSMNFALLVGLGFFNTIGARLLTFVDHIKRNGLIRATKGWIADIKRYGLFWKQRYIREWKKQNGLINLEEIFTNLEARNEIQVNTNKFKLAYSY